MVIFLNSDGSCQKVTPEHVYQGSNNVNEITVIAPFAKTTALQIGFVLPNGLYWKSSDGERYAPMEYMPQSITDNANAWHFNLPLSVTEQEGDLYIALNAVTAQGNTTSYMCRVIIEESVLPDLPATPEPGVYDLLSLYIQQLNDRTKDPLVTKIEKVPGTDNAFTYTDNKGLKSFPIVIGEGSDPPAYLIAAYTGVISKSAWEPVYADDSTTVTGYKAVIPATTHGQMQNGATIKDLWVEFGEVNGNHVNDAVERYTIDASGNITIAVAQPIGLAVRIWNGKGLKGEDGNGIVSIWAEQATDDGTRTTTPLTITYTKSPPKQINVSAKNGRGISVAYISYNVGTSGTIPPDVGWQSTIPTVPPGQYLWTRTILTYTDGTTNTSYTVSYYGLNFTEQDQEDLNSINEQIPQIQSDIEGLREDVSNESHFRGMFESVAALQEAYPTATPNDYAYIVGGNTYIWQNNAWTDSRKPSPNTSVPGSDATPLMDGVASAGTSGNYSRGDHRHPSDTSRVPILRKINNKALSSDITLTPADIGALAVTDNAASASKLQTSQAIDGVTFDGSAAITHYGICSSSNIKEKTVSITGFTLVVGARVTVHFEYSSTVTRPQLNVNGTGAKYIVCDSDVNYIKWKAGSVITFIYTGTQWKIIGGYALASYPVGSVYINESSSSSPAILFGGTWTQIGDYYGSVKTQIASSNYISCSPGVDTDLITLSIPANSCAYLTGYVEANVTDSSTIMNCGLRVDNKLVNARTTLSNGGGVVVSMVIPFSTAARTAKVHTYCYRSVATSFKGEIHALIMTKLGTQWMRTD